MKSLFKLLLSCTLFAGGVAAAKEISMTPETLLKSVKSYAEEVEAKNNLISFKYHGVSLYCIWDKNADRMRLLSPIVEVKNVSQEVLLEALQANYHSALDARYAVGDDIIYSAFIHPLSPLTIEELQSAIRQVATAAVTFGDQYTSGELVFPGNNTEEKEQQQPEV